MAKTARKAAKDSDSEDDDDDDDYELSDLDGDGGAGRKRGPVVLPQEELPPAFVPDQIPVRRSCQPPAVSHAGG